MTNEWESPSVLAGHRLLSGAALLLLVCFSCCCASTQSLTVVPSRSVTLPWTSNTNTGTGSSSQDLLRDDNIASLHHAFDAIVDTSEYLECFARGNEPVGWETSPSQGHFSSCRIPALGDNIVIDFYHSDHAAASLLAQDKTSKEGEQETNVCNCFVLKVSGASLEEFGWICAKFYGDRQQLVGGLLNTDELRKQVASHYSRQPPSPGYTATIEDAEEEKLQQTSLRDCIRDVDLRQLEEQGYVVIDPARNTVRDNPGGDTRVLRTTTASFEVSDQSQADLSQYLTETTGDVYRKDMVNFLTQSEATSAGIGKQFAMLMSIATFLNNNIDLRLSDDKPIPPATIDAPLTVPHVIQLAQYSQGDYYDAHSDNSYESDEGNDIATASSLIRSNFRHFTCILYCSDLHASDGGALRLYLNSRELRNNNRSMESVVAASSCSFIDIVPQNGRLLIFDSCLVHSVQKVTSPTKLRRALTLWILRPDDSGVTGEAFY